MTLYNFILKLFNFVLFRKVHERSVCQKIPLKALKTLYMRWRSFEEKYGDETSVNEVRNKAMQLLEKVKVQK